MNALNPFQEQLRTQKRKKIQKKKNADVDKKSREFLSKIEGKIAETQA